MNDDQATELKIKINTFIWENGPADMTLAAAEKAAIALFDALKPNSKTNNTSFDPT